MRRAIACVSLAAALVAGVPGRAQTVSGPAPVISYIAGSTVKLEQLIGETDKQRHAPTLSRTRTRYHIDGTVGQLGHALDTIATTDAREPESGVRLDFLTVPGAPYLTIQPPGISMGPFEVPVSGIDLGGKMYVVVKTNHSVGPATASQTDRSVLTRFTPPASFQPLRTMSQLPAGRFTKMSLHVQPGTIDGLPPGGPYVLVWGTGSYRRSDAYLSIVPVAQFESGKGTLYFSGLDATNAPTWSARESDAKAIVTNGTLGDLSVTWSKDLNRWLMTYDFRSPKPTGIAFSYASKPWGPWSEPQVVFSAVRDGALGTFIHDPSIHPDDGLAGPVIGEGRKNPGAVRGGEYAPYVIERWTKVSASELDLYYVMSTWNPYVVVLMKSRLRIG